MKRKIYILLLRLNFKCLRLFNIGWRGKAVRQFQYNNRIKGSDIHGRRVYAGNKFCYLKEVEDEKWIKRIPFRNGRTREV